MSRPDSPARPGPPVPGSTWARVAMAGDDQPLSGLALARSLLFIGALLFLLFNWRGVGGMVFGLALATMILLHEAGHFVAAKAAGMKVTQFFIGFGPRLWSFRRGETEYGIKLLPLGGYVRVIGMHSLEEVAPEDEARTYRAASFPRRLAMVCAGSFVHLLLALGLFIALLCGFGLAGASTTIKALPPHTDGAPATPAEVAGLKPGDRIISIGGVATKSWSDVRAAIEASGGKSTLFTVRRHGQSVSLPVVAKPYSFCDGKRLYVGMEPGTQPFRTGPSIAVRAVGDYGKSTLGAIVDFFSPSNLRRYQSTLSDASKTPAPTGCAALAPVEGSRFLSLKGAVDVGTSSFHGGIRPFLELLAGLNVSVGLLNMLPLLPLDGGHAVLAIYERIRSRKNRRYRANIMKLVPLTWAVVAIMVTVSMSSLYLDVKRPPVPSEAPPPVPVAVTEPGAPK